MALREVVARNLRRLRRSQALSQEELAERMGVTRLSVMALEKGKAGASIGNLLKALTVMGLAFMFSCFNVKPAASGPEIAWRTNIASSTPRVIGPSLSSDQHSVIEPVRGTRP